MVSSTHPPVLYAATRQAPLVAHPPPSTYVATGELEDDIQIQAEQIRRERKRKQAAEVAAAAAVEVAQKEDERPLVGNLIGEDHANYVLMCNMLTGIRIAVSQCQVKIKRPLTDQDFTARHKYSFDILRPLSLLRAPRRPLLRCHHGSKARLFLPSVHLQTSTIPRSPMSRYPTFHFCSASRSFASLLYLWLACIFALIVVASVTLFCSYDCSALLQAPPPLYHIDEQTNQINHRISRHPS
ncbi:hypothetical protein EDB19DRAFT_161442 [Suillus lakei]|nr:hypothetical protein EDB19DRAFT_161442 [Suillus lakei]